MEGAAKTSTITLTTSATITLTFQHDDYNSLTFKQSLKFTDKNATDDNTSNINAVHIPKPSSAVDFIQLANSQPSPTNCPIAASLLSPETINSPNERSSKDNFLPFCCDLNAINNYHSKDNCRESPIEFTTSSRKQEDNQLLFNNTPSTLIILLLITIIRFYFDNNYKYSKNSSTSPTSHYLLILIISCLLLLLSRHQFQKCSSFSDKLLQQQILLLSQNSLFFALLLHSPKQQLKKDSSSKVLPLSPLSTPPIQFFKEISFLKNFPTTKNFSNLYKPVLLQHC